MKAFAWSWSKLKNYRTCPKRHYEIDISKNIVEPESEPLKWGHEVHLAMAKRVDKETPLPRTMEHYDEWPQKLFDMKRRGATMLVENKLAMSAKFAPTSYFDNATWFRGVVDVLSVGVKAALTIDWKTGGKIDPEFEQLGLSSQLIFAHNPEVDQVYTVYVWLGHTHDDGRTMTTRKTYTRDAMVPLWNGLYPVINQMTEAARTTTYPPNPSGLCIRHCPVTSCPYYGKGSPR